KQADIIACVALDIPVVAYLCSADAASTITLERTHVPDNGYIRTFDRPVTGWPFDAALAKAKAADAYIELRPIYPPFPRRRFGVILADPAWDFQPYSKETGMDRSAENHYPVLDVNVIAGVGPFIPAADDCVLFLWATSPMLPQALKVMTAWGF